MYIIYGRTGLYARHPLQEEQEKDTGEIEMGFLRQLDHPYAGSDAECLSRKKIKIKNKTKCQLQQRLQGLLGALVDDTTFLQKRRRQGHPFLLQRRRCQQATTITKLDWPLASPPRFHCMSVVLVLQRLQCCFAGSLPSSFLILILFHLWR